MRRAIVIALASAGLAVASIVLAGDETGTDASLEAELRTLLDRIGTEEPVDPFTDGRRPDLAVLSSNSVLGEVGPCG